MKPLAQYLAILLGFWTFAANAFAEEKLKALIIDGQNNHTAWPKTTAMMKKYLEDTGRFRVDIERTKYTWRGEKFLKDYSLDDKEYEHLKGEPKTDPDFAPNFSDYDVVISNFGWKAAAWPEDTQVAFEKYIADGGGLVIVHAANNSFGKWAEFNEMIGLGGWDGRNESSGPYVYYNDVGEIVKDDSKGRGGAHGPQREFAVVVRDSEHPITKGLPKTWMHVKDELYQMLRGPAKNMKILATAFANKEFGGTDRHEPVIMTINYKKGRVFHTPLGHADYSFECVGLIVTFLRGTEWAATGNVTMTSVPDDFPTTESVSTRKFE